MIIFAKSKLYKSDVIIGLYSLNLNYNQIDSTMGLYSLNLNYNQSDITIGYSLYSQSELI